VQANDGEVFVAIRPLADYDDTVDRLVFAVVGGTFVILGVLGLVGFWVVHLGIRPVDRMTETATAIAAGDLSARVPDAKPGTEAGRLGLALNTMLQRIEEAFAERARSEQRLRQFVADASHELRTPVATIRGYAELYRIGGLAGAGELDDAMRRTEQESVRMSRLVDDLLDLARLDEGRPLERRPVDMGALLEDAASDARAVDPTRTVTVAHDPGLVVQGDEDRLRQVLGNVMTNALVHTPAGTPIDAEARTDGEAVVIAITDHGEGMPPDVAERVTERFFRADPSRSRAGGGSGLGLAIVAAVVGAHGGSVRVDSEVGTGTTVRVTLPAPRPF
jgi:two-component system OmpR family sensor kinase